MMSELDSLGAEEDSASGSPSEREQSSFGIVQFGFHAKTSHDADEALLQTRSENYRAPPAPPDNDIWKRPPPDFRYLVYDPKPPKRNTVDSQQPWLYGTLPGKREKVKRDRTSLMPLIFRQRAPSPPPLVTRFHVDRPFTAKKRFVTDGMYPAGYYESPKPHDFRQYPPIKSLGLDEFETSYAKDPYDIHFKTDRLDVIHGLHRGPAERDLINERQMAPPLSAKPKWDSQLILQKTPWPQKYEAFTRFRRRHRNPYSAFMERVERDVETKWSIEKQQFESRLHQSEDQHLHHGHPQQQQQKA
ncbi:putative uncharacterized protein C7orf78 [Babylonia areolata]|uniref:putative uncharacterized protein C7orf78 n=1 Tax=Babylonia areolata TaxID=304850 RepID=UPI003FD1AC9D